MEARQLYVLTALQILGIGVLFWLLVAWKTPWNTQRYIGTLLAVMGVSLFGIARYELGKAFSVKPEVHELVTRGLYSKIRNPIYVFGIVTLTGVILVIQKPELWIVLVFVVITQVIRAHREARVLEAAFGDAYREYRRRTWF
jgi:protein-S-isoprenylcysteine O-methyltransferase Ste14